jgi:hypothetical protein
LRILASSRIPRYDLGRQNPSFLRWFCHTYPLKAKYVELMVKEKGYNSSHVYCQAKGWSKKS